MKTVLITGGSRGIGASCVKLFSEAGYSVAFTYKNSEAAAQALAKKYGALAILADNQSEADITAAVERTVLEYGRIDCLINNASVSSFSLLQDVSRDTWDKTLGTNLTGAFLYSKLVLPHMIRQGAGRIINISSVWGLVGSSMEVHYSATKAALIGMTKALAKELGPSGITVNAIAPGVINTDMNSALSEDDIASLIEGTPLCRIGEPSEVASVALFLAGEGATFITGEVINVSGGFVIN